MSRQHTDRQHRQYVVKSAERMAESASKAMRIANAHMRRSRDRAQNENRENQ
jgi:hypothetical protein